MHALAVLLLTSQRVALSPGPHHEPIEPVQTGASDVPPALPPPPPIAELPPPDIAPPDPPPALLWAAPWPPPTIPGPSSACGSITPVQAEIRTAKKPVSAARVGRPE